MPLKNKKSRAATEREAKKAAKIVNRAPSISFASDSGLHHNGAASSERIEEGSWNDSDELDKSGDEDGTGYRSDTDESEGEIEGIKGTLYEHFYRKQSNEKYRANKRARSDTVGATSDMSVKSGANIPTKKAKPDDGQCGIRGKYMGTSRTTEWRNRKHVQKCASDIRMFFPSRKTETEAKVLPETVLLESDTDSEIDMASAAANAASHTELPKDDARGREGNSGVLIKDMASEGYWVGIGKPENIRACSSQPLDKVASIDADKATLLTDKVDMEANTISDYHEALILLEKHMNELKINIPVQIASLPEENGPNALEAKADEEPTLEDTEILAEESIAQQEGDDGEGDKLYFAVLGRHLQRTIDEEKGAKKPNWKMLLELTTLSDYNNLRESYRAAGHRAPSTEASNRIAEAKFIPTEKKPVFKRECWLARSLRRKATYLINFGCLPTNRQGQGATHSSLLDREDIVQGIQSYLRMQKVGVITPVRLQRELNSNILPALGIESQIGLNTTRKWIFKLGFRRVEHRKAVYMDGHERSDVVESRKKFLDTINEIYIQQYDEKTDKPIPMNLPEGQKRLVPVAHDECAIHANDRVTHSYLRDDEQQLRQKGKGRLIHVSDFITEEWGRLALPPSMVKANKNLPADKQLHVTDARVVTEPGKNRDDWWNQSQLCHQIVNSIPIFERLHPGCKAVYLFDQSSAHGSFSDDALVAKRMNVGPGGKAKPMHSTTIPLDNPHPHLRGKFQSMVFESGPNAGQSKGMRIVLEERGLLQTLVCGRNGQPVGTCRECAKSDEARAKEEKEARQRMDEDPELFTSLNDAGFEDISKKKR